MTSPMRLHWLDPRKPLEPFPSADLALSEPNGLLAIGGDLSVSRLLNAYRHGIFPWFNPDEPILWWSPDPRTVFELPAGLRISRRLRRTSRQGSYALTLDQAFTQVIDACSQPRRNQRGTWLGPQMIEAYVELYRRGHAHSVEVWRERELVGGVYGVAIGQAFFGESMFSLMRDASKLALLGLGRQLAAWGFGLLDCQVGSPHLHSLGAQDMPRREFLARLADLTDRPGRSGTWRFELPDLPDPGIHAPAR